MIQFSLMKLERRSWIVFSIILFCFFCLVLINFSINSQLSSLSRKAQNKYARGIFDKTVSYNVYVWKMPSGYIDLTMESFKASDMQKILCKSTLSLRPLNFMKFISGDNIGLRFSSFFDRSQFLPISFEQQSKYSEKKGKNARKIRYYHQQLFMERRGNQEDILDDTRDFLSLVAWLISQNYDDVRNIKSTLNIEKKIYLVVGKVNCDIRERRFKGEKVIQLEMRILQVDPIFKVKHSSLAKVSLFEADQGNYVPLFVHIQDGIFFITAVLK